MRYSSLLMPLLYRHHSSEIFGIVLEKIFTLVTFTLTGDNVLLSFIVPRVDSLWINDI